MTKRPIRRNDPLMLAQVLLTIGANIVLFPATLAAFLWKEARRPRSDTRFRAVAGPKPPRRE